MTQKASQTWSIIILCYNEANSIKRVVQDSLMVLSEISANDGQIVIVNDGSTDDSDAIIKQLQKYHQQITYVKHDCNKGIGEALHSGYNNAKMENVVMVSGDGQFDVKELIPFKQIPNDSFISFYRAENHLYNRQRKLLSLVNRWLNYLFMGLILKDVNFTNAYKTQHLKSLNLKVKSSLVESEICAKLSFLGKTAIEVKSNYHQNKESKSTGASYKIVKQAFVDIPKLLISCLSFKRKVKQKAVTTDFKHVI
ncbi:MAG: glycosyltransferase family 2 protein [Vicingaceae bacterium]